MEVALTCHLVSSKNQTDGKGQNDLWRHALKIVIQIESSYQTP